MYQNDGAEAAQAAAVESQAVSEPTSAVDTSADSSSTQTQLEPQTADALFVESAADPIPPVDLTTDQEEVDAIAFDAALGEFESDPLESDLAVALL